MIPSERELVDTKMPWESIRSDVLKESYGCMLYRMKIHFLNYEFGVVSE